MTPTIICADWGKYPRKRRAWELRRGSLTIQPTALQGVLGFQALLDYAYTLDGPVVLAIDAAIGVPRHVVERFQVAAETPDADFFDWIRWLFDNGDPDYPCRSPADWHPGRPFIHVPPGKGGKRAFPDNGIGLTRAIDRGLSANSPIIVSGIPGTVGSGSRELWREIASSLVDRPGLKEQIWPFGGTLDTLLEKNRVVVCEIYPKACYGIALSTSLPTRLLTIAKTRERARAAALSALATTLPTALSIAEPDRCRVCDDDFDAMISVVALSKMLGSDLMKNEPSASDRIEGDILGRLALINPGQA